MTGNLVAFCLYDLGVLDNDGEMYVFIPAEEMQIRTFRICFPWHYDDFAQAAQYLKEVYHGV